MEVQCYKLLMPDDDTELIHRVGFDVLCLTSRQVNIYTHNVLTMLILQYMHLEYPVMYWDLLIFFSDVKLAKGVTLIKFLFRLFLQNTSLTRRDGPIRTPA